MFKENEIEKIRSSLEKGNNILIRKSKDDILVIEQRTRTISRFNKNRDLSGKEFSDKSEE